MSKVVVAVFLRLYRATEIFSVNTCFFDSIFSLNTSLCMYMLKVFLFSFYLSPEHGNWFRLVTHIHSKWWFCFILWSNIVHRVRIFFGATSIQRITEIEKSCFDKEVIQLIWRLCGQIDGITVISGNWFLLKNNKSVNKYWCFFRNTWK